MSSRTNDKKTLDDGQDSCYDELSVTLGLKARDVQVCRHSGGAE